MGARLPCNHYIYEDGDANSALRRVSAHSPGRLATQSAPAGPRVIDWRQSTSEMLLRSLQAALPALLPRSAAALSTSTARRGLEELIVLPPKEGEKPASTGASGIESLMFWGRSLTALLWL